MKKIYTLIIIFCLVWLKASTQSKFQVGIQAGPTNYFGDLAQDNPMGYLEQTEINFGAFARYYVNDYFNLRTGYNYGWFKGTDKNSSNASRNLEFKTQFSEIDLLVEYNFLGYQPNQYRRPITPYAFAGVTYLSFNPRRYHRGRWVDLQPLGTEGQGTSAQPDFEKYDLNEFLLKFGVGGKFALTESITLHVEFDIRKAYTDYLDDVSNTYAADFSSLINENGPIAAELSWPAALLRNQEINNFTYPAGQLRGNISQEDWYASLNVGLSFNFIAKKYRRNKNVFRNLARCFKFKKSK